MAFFSGSVIFFSVLVIRIVTRGTEPPDLQRVSIVIVMSHRFAGDEAY